MLTQQEKTALFIEIHRAIEDVAMETARALREGTIELTYPPNAGLSANEQAAIKSLALNSDSESALRKVVANAASAPLFELFSLLDGVGDPEEFEGEWLGVELNTPSGDEEQGEMLHDEFFETYWAWRDRRPDPGWNLDALEG